MKVALILLVVLFDSSLAVWNFRPATSQGNCLTIPDSNNDNEAAFSIATCSSSNTYQQLTGAYVGNPFVWLVPYISPECNITLFAVDTTTSAGSGNGAPVVTAAFDPGNKAQYWARLTPPSGALPGYVWYQNLATGRCMTMENGGAYIDQWDCSSGLTNTHQMWSVSPGDSSVNEEGGNSVLKNQQLLGTQCLNVKNYNPNPGAALDAQLCNTASYAQNFGTISTHQGVTWKVVGSGKCMDGNTQMPVAPFQYPCTPTAQNHHWLEFYYLGDAVTRHFMNVATSLCLTWNPDNLNDVHTEACGKDNVNQKWIRTQP